MFKECLGSFQRGFKENYQIRNVEAHDVVPRENIGVAEDDKFAPGSEHVRLILEAPDVCAGDWGARLEREDALDGWDACILN